MEEEKKLYPMLFAELKDEYAWGSESFALADLGYRDSTIRNGWLSANSIGEIMDTYIDRVVGDNVYEYYGRQFPICVRFIEVRGRMPLRVHPDDEVASQRYDFLGKEKFWYIVSAGKDARLGLGFKKETAAAELVDACTDGSVSNLLNTIVPHAGEAYHIKPGTVHYATGPMLIAEIAESSPMDFCLCSWGQTPGDEEFDSGSGVVEALDFIDLGAYRHEKCEGAEKDQVKKLLRLPQMSVSRVTLNNPLRINSDSFNSFLSYTCIRGEAQLSYDSRDYVFAQGATILVPAECEDFFLVPRTQGTVLLEAMVERREDSDPYLGKAGN